MTRRVSRRVGADNGRALRVISWVRSPKKRARTSADRGRRTTIAIAGMPLDVAPVVVMTDSKIRQLRDYLTFLLGEDK